MNRSVALFALSFSLTAGALDASLPDASAGMGGADMNNEENEMRDPCLAAKDCDRGFSCINGRCQPAPVRNATSGCGGLLAVLTLPLAAGLVLLGRRR